LNARYGLSKDALNLRPGTPWLHPQPMKPEKGIFSGDGYPMSSLPHCKRRGWYSALCSLRKQTP